MKRFLCICTAGLFFLGSVSPALANETSETELAPNTKSAILIERDTGTILYAKNENEKLAPASMTKILTMILIMEAIEEDRIAWDDKVTTSEYAASMGGSQIFLEPGEAMTVKEMLTGIAIGSANDAAVAMAEKLAGSEQAFVVQMNKRAKELGLKNTHFSNCTGLPVENHYSSAKDMALMGKELLKHPEITKFTGTYESYLRENTDEKFWLVNTNRLVKFYPGVDGLKTGFTNESKYCLTATAVKDDMRLIAVVFGADNPKERNAQVTSMLDYGFSHYDTSEQFKKDDHLALVPVEKGNHKRVTLAVADDVTILTKKGEKLSHLEPKMHLNKDIHAPLSKGAVLGKVVIEKDGKVIAESKLVAAEDITSASWAQLFGRTLGNFTQVKLTE